MKKIEDECFEKIRQINKKKELFDFSTVEVRVAMFFSVIITIISILINVVNGSNAFVEVVIPIIKDFAIAFIGFLGFVVAALAILTGSISSRIVAFFKEKNILEELQSILLSFYFIGMLIGIDILIIVFIYMIALLKINSFAIINIIITFAVSYLTVFIIFYAIGLIGNCISIFNIISNVEEQLENQEKNDKQIYDSYRIMALEYIILTNLGGEKIKKYDDEIERLILSDKRTTDKQKRRFYQMNKVQFSKNKKGR